MSSNTIDDLMYKAGLTAQGCWDEMDEYDHTAILKFAELIVRECCDKFVDMQYKHPVIISAYEIKKHFGVEE